MIRIHNSENILMLAYPRVANFANSGDTVDIFVDEIIHNWDDLSELAKRYIVGDLTRRMSHQWQWDKSDIKDKWQRILDHANNQLTQSNNQSI